LKLEPIQRRLESIYNLPPTPPVEFYLIGTEELGRLVPEGAAPGPQVLVQASEDETRLAVHVGDDILRRDDLSAYLSATEEVSHFLFLVWSSLNHRPVTLLDIELQGEIDKFLLASRRVRDPGELLTRVFQNVRFEPHLTPASVRLYEQANRLAWRFCRALVDRVDEEKTMQRALRWLRRFYRMTSRARLAHVHAL